MSKSGRISSLTKIDIGIWSNFGRQSEEIPTSISGLNFVEENYNNFDSKLTWESGRTWVKKISKWSHFRR